VLVYHDLLALNPDFQPRHNRIFGEAGNLVRQAIMAYASEVRAGAFPTESHTRRMAEAEYQQLKESLLQPR
jgi:3-methyl-2-oxobutanoate hydroxymethyltransferase